jgi:hypothetical protein
MNPILPFFSFYMLSYLCIGLSQVRSACSQMRAGASGPLQKRKREEHDDVLLDGIRGEP